MSKKTNSLLYRFGISTLWTNKSIRKKKISNVIQLENLVYKELKCKNLKVFCICYKRNYITVYVYNNINVNKNLTNILNKYYKKVLNIRKVISKFGLSQLLLFKLLKSKKYNILFIYSFDNFVYFYYKYFFTLFIYFENNYKYNYFEQIKWIFNILFILTKYKEFLIFNSNKIIINIFKNSISFKLRKINGLIKFKFLNLYIENIIFKKTSVAVYISLKNIFFQKGIFFNNNIIKKYRKEKFIFKTLFLSTYYMNSALIAEYLAIALQRNKKHKWVLKKFISILERLFFSNILKFKGFQLRVAGKLNGKMRKSKYHYKLGKTEFQVLNIYVAYSFFISYTKFGVLSLKIWLLNDNFKI